MKIDIDNTGHIHLIAETYTEAFALKFLTDDKHATEIGMAIVTDCSILNKEVHDEQVCPCGCGAPSTGCNFE